MRPAQPAGAERDWRDVRGGGAVWARRGEVFAVHASGNAPGVHGLWPQALMLGYRVAVRPSRREPFTGQRLIAALRECGFRAEDVCFLPTDYTGADEIIRAADLAMVYGGQDVVDKYATDPTVWVNGPGRAKILITAEQDWREHLDVIVESICAYGGTACVNTTAVLYEGDAAPLAEAIAERLSTLSPLPLTDERAILPVVSSPPRSPSRTSSAHGPPEQRRCSAPIRWSPTSVTGPPRCDPRCTCSPPRTRQVEHRTGISVRLGVTLVARGRPGPCAVPGGQRHHRRRTPDR